MIEERTVVRNECYIKGRKRGRTYGVMIHDTAVAGVDADKFAYNYNVYNPGGRSVCVHAFADDFKVVEILPNELRCWGCGSGNNGSGNGLYVQIEMCVPTGVVINNKTWKYSITPGMEVEVKNKLRMTLDNVEMYVINMLNKYNITEVNSTTVTSHYEGHLSGIASNHGDPKELLGLLGLTMNDVRDEIREKFKTEIKKNNVIKMKQRLVRVTASVLNVRAEPSTRTLVVGQVRSGQVFTIVDISKDGNWGKLKSGAGWICLKYTEDVLR